MQFLIDTATESRAGLLLAAQVLLAYAHAMPEETIDAGPRLPITPKPLQQPAVPPIGPAPIPAPVIPLPPGNVPPPPVVHPPFHPDATPPVDVPAGTPDEVMLDPAVVFGRGPVLNDGGTVPIPPRLVSEVPAAPLAPAPLAIADVTSVIPTAPAVATTPAVVPPATDERDSEGLPWDARIHSETRKKNADGTWRYRRNLDVTVKGTVYKELKERYTAAQGGAAQAAMFQPAIGLPGAVPVPPAPPALPVAPVAAVAVPVPPAPPAGTIPAPPVVPPAPTATVLPFPAATALPVPPANAVGVPNAPNAPVVPAATSFRDLMLKVNQALAGGRLTQAQLAEACKAAGVDGVSALAAVPMMVPQVDQYLQRWLAA